MLRAVSMRLLVSFAGLLALFCDVATVNACTRIFWNSNGQAKIVGRTTDLYTSDHARLIYSPRGVVRSGRADANSAEWTSKHATFAVTAFDVAISDGMNEHGLAAHLLYLDGTRYEARDNRPGLSNGLWAQYAIDNFKTVEEALQGLSQVQVVSTSIGAREWPVHLALEDASGNSAIVEFVNGRMVVHHGRQFVVMANEPSYDQQLAKLSRYKLFGGDQPIPGDIDSISRFARASSFLEMLPEPKDYRDALAGIVNVTRSVMAPPGAVDTSGNDGEDAWPTLWMTAADLTHGTYYFSATSSPNLFWVDFKNFDSTAGGPVLSLDPYNPALVGDVSKLFTAETPATVR